MKEHLCSVEKALINYEGECNWCGEREGGMTQDELIKRLETTCFGLDPIDPLRLLVDDVVAALAQTERTWVGLTDEDIDQLHTAWVLEGGFLKLCDDIEAKLKDKNT